MKKQLMIWLYMVKYLFVKPPILVTPVEPQSFLKTLYQTAFYTYTILRLEHEVDKEIASEYPYSTLQIKINAPGGEIGEQKETNV